MRWSISMPRSSPHNWHSSGLRTIALRSRWRVLRCCGIRRLAMADIAREGNQIVLKLSTGERIMAMHRDVRVPLSALKSAAVVDEPIRRIQGLKPRNFKVFGGYWPGWFAYGSFFDGAVRQLLFAAVNAETSRTGDHPRRRQAHPPDRQPRPPRRREDRPDRLARQHHRATFPAARGLD